MKKIPCLLFALFLFACVTTPTLLFLDADGLQEAVQPYVEAWGPYSVVNTHICDECEGVAIFFWFEYGRPVHYVQIERIDGIWVVTKASEHLPTNYQNRPMSAI